MAPMRPTAALVLPLLSVAAVACQQLPVQRGRDVQVLDEGGLAERNPAEVVVAPVELATPDLKVPDVALRSAFQDALVRRRYSPLALDFVDSRVIEASYPAGTLGEEAVCRILVHRWDERLWDTGRILDVDVELRMEDPADPDGRDLWAGRLAGRIDVTSEETRLTEPALYRYALEEVALELTSRLPMRTTAPGRQ